jgi:hypothetical protein
MYSFIHYQDKYYISSKLAKFRYVAGKTKDTFSGR